MVGDRTVSAPSDTPAAPRIVERLASCEQHLNECENALERLAQAYYRLVNPQPTAVGSANVTKVERVQAVTIEGRVGDLAQHSDGLQERMHKLATDFDRAI